MKITFKMTDQFFFMSAVTKIFLNEVECAWLGKGEQAVIDAPDGTSQIKIKGSIREKNLTIEAKQDVTVSIKWNRITGGIDTLVTGPDVKVVS